MSITITFYGTESDKATKKFRQELKHVPTAFYDDCTDYFILYNVKQFRQVEWVGDGYKCFGYIVFDDADGTTAYIEENNFDLEF